MIPSDISAVISSNAIREVECIFPDINGIPRGKALPAHSFVAGQQLRCARAIPIQCITGEYPDYEYYGEHDPDVTLIPDYNTFRLVPWASKGRALVIMDCEDKPGELTPLAPRTVLKKVLNKYEQLGLTPVVAPELEFYVLAPNPDPSQPLQTPIDRLGRREIGESSFSFTALNSFSAFWDELLSTIEMLGINGDTFVHEMGPGQFEINLKHGNALELADQTFLFKYAMREVGAKHGLLVVCMAKPMSGVAGSSMHIHQSLIKQNGENVFSLANGEPSPIFHYFIAGQQTYLPHLMPYLAPNVNSYRRFVKGSAAPINLSWGIDNRSVGLRVPHAPPQARRVENRLPGCDANPYLSLAASLASGLLGIEEQLKPSDPVTGNVYGESVSLPSTLDQALQIMRSSNTSTKCFGEEFTRAYIASKEVELTNYYQEISSWERRYLAGQV
ncbi:glutamine synthetase family protein [Leeia sp. TBRC 13508]|uniref:Glutamine synthetase family protein n=1 Tax=Leeia speluncae TaxID=2884804 RepID=A0ABS8D9F2_9NEIS|nr:glutamine synthetase family protein [Leeia speluncae]MCB6184844.1 glutamine synthetase family protein [Leeia speluncae]